MLTIIFAVVFGTIFAIFATQNTNFVNIILGTSAYSLPLYMVMLGALLLGLFVGWIFQLVDSIGNSATMYGKDSQIKQHAKEVEEMRRKLHNVELENVRLRAERDDANDHTHEVIETERPTLGERLRQRLSF